MINRARVVKKNKKKQAKILLHLVMKHSIYRFGTQGMGGVKVFNNDSIKEGFYKQYHLR